MRPVVSSSLCACAGAVKSAAMIAASAASAASAATAARRAVRVIGGSFGWRASLRKLGLARRSRNRERGFVLGTTRCPRRARVRRGGARV